MHADNGDFMRGESCSTSAITSVDCVLWSNVGEVNGELNGQNEVFEATLLLKLLFVITVHTRFILSFECLTFEFIYSIQISPSKRILL